MTLTALISSVLGALVFAGVAVMFLRTTVGGDEVFHLTFDTTTSRARDGWAAFWARDPFVRAQRERKGLAFATYEVPGGEQIAAHIAPADVHQHTLILGSTGSGKSSLLELFAQYHLRHRQPFALIDLHGDLFTRTAAWALTLRTPRLILLDFTRPELLPGWNPLTRIEGVDIGRQVDLIVGVLKRLYAGESVASWSWGVKAEEILRYALRACIESASPQSLVDLPSFLLMPAVREGVLATASEETRAYFEMRFGAREEMYVSAVLNKLEPFLGSLSIQRFLGQPTSRVDLFAAMERGDTILVNLAKGYLGPTADVMGRLLVNVLQLAAQRRESIPPEKRTPYALLLDEAHVLAAANSGLEDFLVAARKYKVFVTLASQGLSLFPPSFRPHLLGNTARQFFFRLPHREAQALAPDIFEPLGSIWREQMRPNEAIDEPLLSAAEEIAWRTRELASLGVGSCYWYAKERPYKARRIQIQQPLDLPFTPAKLQRAIDNQMARQKGLDIAEDPESAVVSAMQKAIAERSARREASPILHVHRDE